MDRQTFSFTEEQRKRLLTCWKKKHEKALAVDFLDTVEFTIGMWRGVALPNPPTNRKEQQQQLDNLALKAKEMIRAFEGLSLYVASALPFVLHFKMHDEYPSNSKVDHLLISPLPGQSPQGQAAYHLIAEAFPDPVTQADFCMEFLRRVKYAAENFGLEHQHKQPRISKYKEASLLAWLIEDYQTHFGKYPTATNARTGDPESTSPFRRFTADIGNILNLKFGAQIIRDAIAEAKNEDLQASQIRHNQKNKSTKN